MFRTILCRIIKTPASRNTRCDHVNLLSRDNEPYVSNGRLAHHQADARRKIRRKTNSAKFIADQLTVRTVHHHNEPVMALTTIELTAEINVVEFGGYDANRSYGGGQRRGPWNQQEEMPRCERCGRDSRRQRCPAIGKSCYACGGRDHLSSVCFVARRSAQ